MPPERLPCCNQMYVPKQIEATELIAVIASSAERCWEA
jgi:hypothetical protein